MTTKTQKQDKRELQKAFAENFVRSIESRVTFLTTKTLNRIICSFENDALCKNARTAIENKPETGLRVYDTPKNKNQSFYVAFTKVNVESVSIPPKDVTPESSKDDNDSNISEVSSNPVIDIDNKIDKETLDPELISRIRKVGIGIKINSSNQVEFYNEQHREMFEKVVGVFQIGKKISQESLLQIKDLLGEFDDAAKLIDDFHLAEWIMKAENVQFQSTCDIVEKGLHGEPIEPRTAPFIFKNEKDAKYWFNILNSIGFKPAWQPKEPRNFWLAQRPPRRKKHNRTKRHEISNALESLNVKGHPNDTEYYYQNSVQRSHCFVMHKTATKDERSKFIEDLVVKLCEKMPEWEFILDSKKTGFHYVNLNKTPAGEEVCDEQNNEQGHSKNDKFIKMFSEEQWQYLLTNTPREMLIKVFPSEFSTKQETVNVEKQKLKKISENFLLIGKDHPMISGIMAMDSKSLKKVEDI